MQSLAASAARNAAQSSTTRKAASSATTASTTSAGEAFNGKVCWAEDSESDGRCRIGGPRLVAKGGEMRKSCFVVMPIGDLSLPGGSSMTAASLRERYSEL